MPKRTLVKTRFSRTINLVNNENRHLYLSLCCTSLRPLVNLLCVHNKEKCKPNGLPNNLACALAISPLFPFLIPTTELKLLLLKFVNHFSTPPNETAEAAYFLHNSRHCAYVVHRFGSAGVYVRQTCLSSANTRSALKLSVWRISFLQWV